MQHLACMRGRDSVPKEPQDLFPAGGRLLLPELLFHIHGHVPGLFYSLSHLLNTYSMPVDGETVTWKEGDCPLGLQEEGVTDRLDKYTRLWWEWGDVLTSGIC